MPVYRYVDDPIEHEVQLSDMFRQVRQDDAQA